MVDTYSVTHDCSPSACITEVRGKQLLRLTPSELPAWRSMIYSASTAFGNQRWYCINDAITGAVCGEVTSDAARRGSDSVRGYLFARFCTGRCLEAIRPTSSPSQIWLYDNGQILATLCEMEVPQPTSWWRRLLGGNAGWRLEANEQCVGQIQVKYPISKKHRLNLVIEGGPSLPIGLARLWFNVGSRYVIPPDSPSVNADIETLHFVIALVFRTYLFDLDVSSSG